MKATRLIDLLQHQLNTHPLNVCLAGKSSNGWKTYSTQEVIDIVNKLSYGLIKLGIKAGDKIANISINRPEWNFIDLAVLQIGAIHVPIYPTITAEDYKFIFNDAAVKLAFVGSAEIYNRVASIKNNTKSLEYIYSYDKIDHLQIWSELLSEPTSDLDATLKQRMDAVQSEHLATLIYTSGTTGNPKGVMLSHKNIIENLKGSQPRVPVKSGEKALSFLPLCHIFERMITYLYMSLSIEIWYAENMETIGDNLKEVKPNVFSTVPRLLEKVYDKIVGKGQELSGIKKALFFWALNLGLQYELGGKNGWWYEKKLSIANKIIFSKWREALGGNVRAIVTGAAALQPRLARVFWAAQIPVLEGYGLTETSPVIAVNYFETLECKFGSVGTPLQNVTVKLAEDGEILCKGDNVMMGYYNRPDLTAEVIDSDGWFHTGDVGVFEGKYLKITDRKKEIFKTSGGKYIAPQPIENMLKESTLIEQAMVIGENEKFPAAFIVPSVDGVKAYCEHKQIPYVSHSEMLANKAIIDKIQREIDSFNTRLGNWEQIKKFELFSMPWSIDTGELTPTLKLKRKPIMKKYPLAYEKIYGHMPV